MLTLITKKEFDRRLNKEGVDGEIVCKPRWAESAERNRHESSVLAACDAIIRLDGSVVWLDGMMSFDGAGIANKHFGNRRFSLAKAYRKMIYATKSQRRKRTSDYRRKLREFREYADRLRKQ